MITDNEQIASGPDQASTQQEKIEKITWKISLKMNEWFPSPGNPYKMTFYHICWNCHYVLTVVHETDTLWKKSGSSGSTYCL